MIQDIKYPRNWENAMDQQLQKFIEAITATDPHTPFISHARFGLVTMKLLEEIYAISATH